MAEACAWGHNSRVHWCSQDGQVRLTVPTSVKNQNHNPPYRLLRLHQSEVQFHILWTNKFWKHSAWSSAISDQQQQYSWSCEALHRQSYQQNLVFQALITLHINYSKQITSGILWLTIDVWAGVQPNWTCERIHSFICTRLEKPTLMVCWIGVIQNHFNSPNKKGLMYFTIGSGTASQTTPQGRHPNHASHGRVKLAIKLLQALCLDRWAKHRWSACLLVRSHTC